MFQLWGKLWKNSRIVADHMVVNSDPNETRTHKVFQALDEVAHAFDLPVPIWLDSNVREFQKHAKTRFTRDSFIESIDFDYLEIQITEED